MAGGYLRVEKFRFHEEWGREEYELVLTNKEVRTMFERMFRNYEVRDTVNLWRLCFKAIWRK